MKKMYIAFIIIGLALLLVGVVGLTRKDSVKDSPATAANLADKPAEESLPTNSSEQSPTLADNTDESEERMRMGKAFEDFVCSLFSQKDYMLVERVNDYFNHERFAERSLGPDMVFRKKDTGEEFAVECKYRRHWSKEDEKEYVLWASDQNIANYKQFANERKMPVIIVIGIGGEPQSPAELYATPLNALSKYTTARKNYLQNFKLNPSCGLAFSGNTVVNL